MKQRADHGYSAAFLGAAAIAAIGALLAARLLRTPPPTTTTDITPSATPTHDRQPVAA